ncbi:unnamed protein product, partial [Bemisia tabaci]
MTVEECELSSIENLELKKPVDNTRRHVKTSCDRFNPGFLLTPIGVLKFLQIITAGVFLAVLVHHRAKYILVVGFSLKLLFTSLVSGMTLTSVLSLCYALSRKSYNLVHSTIFELQFNGLFAGLYLSMSVYLWICTEYDLLIYHLHPLKFGIHTILVIIEIFCFALGLLYSADALICFVHYLRGPEQHKRDI